jgi:ubiquitin-protein ligase
MQKITPRIAKEIKTGYASKDFEFIYDSGGIYGEAEVCYLKFCITNGVYAGQTHILKVQFVYGNNEVYRFPMHPPNIVFITPIFHPNISECGSICLDVIKPEKWSPMYNLESIFYSIISLLETPNVNSPFNINAAKKYNDHYKTEQLKYIDLCMEYYESKIQNTKITILNFEKFSEIEADTMTKA